jgi:LmbE family N-acetylglucosaminyl deacetylase
VIALTLADSSPRIERVLAIGCHSDDIEIGCGGTLLQLVRARPDLHVTWIVLSAHGERADEARTSAEALLTGVASHDIRVLEHRESFLPYEAAKVKESFEALKTSRPDVVFTHASDDRHQDHRLACELTWNTFRDHLVLEYEIPKYDGDLGRPTVFVPLSEDVVSQKVAHLETHFASQRDKHWFDEELFRSLLRVRGMEAATRYAEAFACRKLCVLA